MITYSGAKLGPFTSSREVPVLRALSHPHILMHPRKSPPELPVSASGVERFLITLGDQEQLKEERRSF